MNKKQWGTSKHLTIMRWYADDPHPFHLHRHPSIVNWSASIKLKIRFAASQAITLLNGSLGHKVVLDATSPTGLVEVQPCGPIHNICSVLCSRCRCARTNLDLDLSLNTIDPYC